MVFAVGPRTNRLRFEVELGSQRVQVFPQLKVAGPDFLLIDPIELYVLPQHEQQFLSPVPLQALGDVLRVAFTPGSTMAANSQGSRFPSKMAPMIFMPLTPLRSLSTLPSCTFISVNTFCMR
jgi:hypothetical protein